MIKRIKILTLASLLLLNFDVQAQLKFLGFLNEKVDTNYISDGTRKFTVRVLGSSKLSGYKFGENTGGNPTLHYKANNSYNIGVGAVYSFLGANLTVKMPGLNDDDDKYGKTKKFDFQAYAFPRKVALDLYLQYYKGFYVKEDGITQTYLPSDKNPLREDIRTQHVGANGSYVFNAKKFSFRAAFIQNEYQKKSAGTPLLGGGIHYNRISGDSAIIPLDITYSNFFNNNRFNKMGSFSAGIHGGYAYTLVIAKHFFVTGVALVGAGANYSYLRDDANDLFDRSVGFQVNLAYKAAIGYNSEKFYVGLLHMNYIQRNSSPIDKAWQQNETGVIRLVLARRFAFNAPWEKKKKPAAVLDIQ